MPLFLTVFTQLFTLADFVAHFLGELFLKKGPHFGAESLFFVAIAQIHLSSSGLYCRALRPCSFT